MAEKYQSGYQKKVGKKKVMLLDAARWREPLGPARGGRAPATRTHGSGARLYRATGRGPPGGGAARRRAD